MEAAVWSAGRLAHSVSTLPANPRSIFVLRNNDLGDVLVITPLFEALRKRFPGARLVAGVGSWSAPLLEDNPYVSEIVPVNAPWHNKVITPNGRQAAFQYIYASAEARALSRRRFDIGIDVLGSPWGSLLLMRCGIPYRLGVQGYAGGHSATQQSVLFNSREQVGRAALRFAELLGATSLPHNQPQIFLSPEEQETAERRWHQLGLPIPNLATRIVVAPGGGFPEKCWPRSHWAELLHLLGDEITCSLLVVGSQADQRAGAELAQAHPLVRSLCGQTSLRETCALVARADLVICNSSFLMHVAAALGKPAVVILGGWFPSATDHEVQWGYPKGMVVFGRDRDRPRIFSPREVYAALEDFFTNHQALAA